MVYDIPRLVNQTMYKILLHVDTYFYDRYYRDRCLAEDEKAKFRTRFYNRDAMSADVAEDTTRLGFYSIYDDDPRTRAMEEDADESELYQRYQLSEISKFLRRRDPDDALRTVSSFGKSFVNLVLAITDRNPSKKVYTDWDAASRFIDHLTNQDTPCRLTADQMQLLEGAYNLSKEATTISGFACNQGKRYITSINENYKPPRIRCKEWAHYKAAHKGIEKVRMSSMTPGVREAHDFIRNNVIINEIDELRVVNNTIYTNLGMGIDEPSDGIFRWLNCYIFSFDNNICILDIANLEQVQIVCKQWEGAYLYAEHYRKAGDRTPDNITPSVRECNLWMHNMFRASGFSDSFCRVMKMGLAILQNKLHHASEKIQTHWETKDKALRETQKETLNLPVQWQDFVETLPLKDRTALDIANMHYFMICPDGDPHALFVKVNDDMAHPNGVNPDRFNDFMKYAVSLFLCKLVHKHGKALLPFISVSEGYNLEDKDWFKYLLNKPKTWGMPPRGEWGKAAVRGFFPYSDYISGWYFDADDVSHIIADTKHYTTYDQRAALTQQETNELLYALKYAPLLSITWDPTQIIRHIEEGTDTYDRISNLSLKAEANKPSHKGRDIHAADDITRTCTSAIDRHCVYVSSLLPGVVSRKGENESEAIFDRLCHLTRKDNKSDQLIVSSDVSSWSPKAPREYWSQFNDEVMAMTQAPTSLRLREVWRGITNIIGTRGYMRVSSTSKGMYQGWTGTSDSCMHNVLLGKIVNDAKLIGLIPKGTTAYTATLIDDAVQIISFDNSKVEPDDFARYYAHLTDVCSRYVEMVKHGYLDVGAEIDLVKTIIADFKAIFLNQMVCEGSKIYTPMKVFAKADRDLKRRSATIFEQVDTIMGSYRSAVEKGSEPIMTYAIALEKSFELVMMTSSSGYATWAPRNYQASHIHLINATFAPRNFGGLGMPHIIGWLTKETRDPLSAYYSIMCSAEQLLKLPGDRANVENILRLRSAVHQTINQPTCKPSLLSFIKDPTRVCILGVVDPKSIIIRRVRDELLKRAESQVFQSLLRKSDDNETIEAIDELLLSGTFSADMLAIIACCIPEHCVSGIVDRSVSNEMVQVIFPFRVRSLISSRVRQANRRALRTLLELDLTLTKDVPPLDRREAYNVVSKVRGDFYATLGYSITNHTQVDFGTVFTHHRNDEMAPVTTRITELISPCQGEGVDYANMYDGHIKRPKLRTPYSKSVYSFGKDFERSADPVRVCIQKAVVISTWLVHNGYSGVEVWDFIKAMWGASASGSYPTVSYKIDEIASIRRFSPLTQNPTHPIACYRGVWGVVEVDASDVGKFVTDSHYAGDYLSVITAIRAITLVDYSLYMLAESHENYNGRYGFIQNSIWEYDPQIWDIQNKDGYMHAIRLLNSTDKSDFATEFMRVVTSVPGDPRLFSDDILVDIRFNQLNRPDANLTSDNRQLFTMTALGYSMPPTNYRNQRSTIVAGDLSHSARTRGLQSRYTTAKSMYGIQSALMAALVEQVCTYLPNEPEMAFIDALWPEVVDRFNDHYSMYLPKWIQISQGIKNLFRLDSVSFDLETFANLFPTMMKIIPQREVGPLLHMAELESDTISTVMCYMYLANHGRYANAEGYSYAARNGILNMKTSWATTAKRYAFRERNVCRNMMAPAFRAMADNAKGMRTAHDFHTIFMQNVRTSMIARTNNQDIPPGPSEFSVLEATLDAEVNASFSWIITWFGMRLNVWERRDLSKILRNTFQDLKIIAMARATKGIAFVSAEVTEARKDVWASLIAMKPNLPDVVVTQQVEIIGIDEVDHHIVYATKLYTSRSIGAAYVYMQSVAEGRAIQRIPSIESRVVTMEDVEEYEYEMRAHELQLAGEQRGNQDIQ